MHKLAAGFILAMALVIVYKAEIAVADTPEVMVAEPNDVVRPEVVPSPSPENLSPDNQPSKTLPGDSPDAVDTQSEAFNICLRATQRFEQQERDKGNGKTAVTSLSASCKTELKPAPYWLCMDKEAIGEVDFNTAHWRCAKQTKLLN
jgi:hypothetical protein